MKHPGAFSPDGDRIDMTVADANETYGRHNLIVDMGGIVTYCHLALPGGKTLVPVFDRWFKLAGYQLWGQNGQ